MTPQAIIRLYAVFVAALAVVFNVAHALWGFLA